MMHLIVDHMPQHRAIALRARSNQNLDSKSLEGSAEEIVRLVRPLGPALACSLGASPGLVQTLVGLLSQRGLNIQPGDPPAGLVFHRHGPAIVILSTAGHKPAQPQQPVAPGLNRVSEPALIGGRGVQHNPAPGNGLNRISVYRKTRRPF